MHDICLNNLHVILCVDRSGNTGNDGETHHGIYDLSYLNTIPNLTIMAPKDYIELESKLSVDNMYTKMWFIKYLHMIYPNYFSTFYVTSFTKRFIYNLRNADVTVTK